MSRAMGVLVVVALAGCGGRGLGLFCTEAGCSGLLVITVVDGSDAPVSDLVGTIILRDRVFAVDCSGTSDSEVTCDGGTITVMLLGEIGGQDVVLDLHRDAVSVTSRLELDWERFDPNGRSCSPTCWSAVGTATVDDPGA